MGGDTRRLLVAEPTATPSMVLLSLHGSRSSPEGQRRLSRMESLAARGAVVAFPQGGLPLGSGWEWDLSGDQAFLEAAVDYLHERFRPSSALAGRERHVGWRAHGQPLRIHRTPRGGGAGSGGRAAVAGTRPVAASRARGRLPRHERSHQSPFRQWDRPLERKRPGCRGGVGTGQRRAGGAPAGGGDRRADPLLASVPTRVREPSPCGWHGARATRGPAPGCRSASGCSSAAPPTTSTPLRRSGGPSSRRDRTVRHGAVEPAPPGVGHGAGVVVDPPPSRWCEEPSPVERPGVLALPVAPGYHPCQPTRCLAS